MRFFFTCLQLFVVLLQCRAQNCLPGSPVSADYPASATTLQNLFTQARQTAELQPAAYEDLKTRINRCNNDMEVALGNIVSQMSELSLKYQQILGYKDVAGIEKQLRDLEESLQKSRTELEQNLGYVKHTGVYAVLLENVDFYKSEKKDLIEQANQAITPRAVDDLVGLSIRRTSAVRDFAPVRDVILEVKNGEVRMEREYFNQPNHIRKTFLFLARVGATPTRQKATGSAPAAAGALVLNLDVDTGFRQKLQEKGVGEADIRRIEQEVLPFLSTIQRDNRTADSRQDYILQNGAEEIRRIEREIEDARLRLQTRSAKIGEICQELGVPFNAGSNFDQSVNGALQKIRDQLASLTGQWNEAVEQEIVYKETRTFVEGSLSQSLAAETLKLCQQIEKGYGQLDRMLQVTEVQDFELSRFESNRTVSVFRAPSRIWAYAMPRDDGAYGVAVFVQFRVTGQQAAGGSGGARLPFEPEMVTVEGGKFQMGCTAEQSDCDNDEKNVHWVQLKRFSIGKTEVTNEQFVAYLNDISPKISLDAKGETVTYNKVEIIRLSDRIKYSNGAWAGGTFSVVSGYEKHPVIYVSWLAAQEYLKWLSAKTGKKYRLPTEAEWEFAARGGNKSKGFKFSGSNTLTEVCLYDLSEIPYKVGQKKPNELGLYDMTGNLWEWCSDWYQVDYPLSPQIDPTGPPSGSIRTYRGGCSRNEYKEYRVSNRGVVSLPSRGYDYMGFRVAQEY